MTPSSPFSEGGMAERLVVATPVLEVTVASGGAPVIWVTANTLPTRSTTAIVAGACSALAWLTAWRTTVLTSLSVRFEVLVDAVIPVAEEVLIPVGEVDDEDVSNEVDEEALPPSPPPQLGAATHSTMTTAVATWQSG